MHSSATQPELRRVPSLRGRVLLLAAAVVALLSITLSILVILLHDSRANLVLRSDKHLQAVARSLARAYESRPDTQITLGDALPMPIHPPPPAPAGPPPPPPGAPPGPRGNGDELALEALTAAVLSDETAVEGGFYRASDQQLVGYAFPTHEGPGDSHALPQRELPFILQVSGAAARDHEEAEYQFYGSHDAVLFMAVPVCNDAACHGGVIGAAWLMQRLPGAETERRRALLWSAFGFGAVACLTVILAFLVLTQVDRGTRAIVDRLRRMESDLAEQPDTRPVGLAEFRRVLSGLDRLRETLLAQFHRERELQTRLRQNERLASIGQLAAGVAHELRNPLATIRLRSEMTQRRTEDAATRQSVELILSEVDRLDGIIERLLDFSRPIRPRYSVVALSAVCEAAHARWAAKYPSVAIELRGGAEMTLSTDRVRLEQALDNLIENAIHQMQGAGTPAPAVQIVCGPRGETIALKVRDNGGGFTPEGLRLATQPFYTTRARGTGLGLAITSEIAQALGGALELRNHERGAEVTLLLPLAPRGIQSESE